MHTLTLLGLALLYSCNSHALHSSSGQTWNTRQIVLSGRLSEISCLVERQMKPRLHTNLYSTGGAGDSKTGSPKAPKLNKRDRRLQTALESTNFVRDKKVSPNEDENYVPLLEDPSLSMVYAICKAADKRKA